MSETRAVTEREPPLSIESSNPGFVGAWTCPGCYKTLPVREPGVHECPRCGRSIRCWTQQQTFLHAMLEEQYVKEHEA